MGYDRPADDPRVSITPGNYPRHTPYWITPDTATSPLDRHDDKLQVLGLIMDPFLPVHAFSSILPIKQLRLPNWSVEAALKRLTAFWHVGPIVTTHDVEKAFSPERRLGGDYIGQLAALVAGRKSEQAEDGSDRNAINGGEELPTVRFPLAAPVAAANGGDARFVYLQPYWREEVQTGEARMAFNPYAIDEQAAAGADAAEAKLAPGPYTALEGYVQMAKPLGDVL